MFLFFQTTRTKVSNGASIFDRTFVVDFLDNEPYFANLWHVFIFLFFLIIGIRATIGVINLYQVKAKALYLFLYLYHFAITFIYYYMAKNGLVFSDARMYYMKSLRPDLISAFDIQFKVGTSFILSIVNFCVSNLGFNYLSLYMLFSTLGYLGLMLFLRSCHELGATKNLTRLGAYVFPLLLFLPNIHFWTVAVGKDSLIFFGLMAVTYSLFNPKARWFYLVIGVFFVFMIRPHVFAMMAVALIITIVLASKARMSVKIPLSIVMGIIVYAGSAMFLRLRFGLSGFDLVQIIELMDSHKGYYVGKSYSGSSVDLAAYPLPLKMMTYLFRPLFESTSVNFLIISIDNLFSLILFSSIFSRKFIWWIRKRANFVVKFSFLYFLLGTAFMANIMSNFGIAVRQKTMFLFSLYIVVIAFLAYKNSAAEQKIVKE